MEVKTVLTLDVDSFILFDLFRKAALYKGLKVQEGTSEAYSEPIKSYELDDRLLAFLAERGIKQQARPDCHDEIFTLVDENPQEKVPGWTPSNYWNFKLLDGEKYQFDLRVTLNVSFGINTEKRGIVFWPRAYGSFFSPVDRLPNLRMFKALVESDGKAPAVALELAASDGNIVVTWTDLGLGGIRKLTDLFAEFAGQNEAIKKLGRNQEVFDPVPNLHHQQSGDELFVVEPAQPRVFQEWRKQLEEYRTSLVA